MTCLNVGQYPFCHRFFDIHISLILIETINMINLRWCCHEKWQLCFIHYNHVIEISLYWIELTDITETWRYMLMHKHVTHAFNVYIYTSRLTMSFVIFYLQNLMSTVVHQLDWCHIDIHMSESISFGLCIHQATQKNCTNTALVSRISIK